MLGARIGSAKVFRYQHVGIGNANVSHRVYCPARTPKVRGFVFQCNIGFNVKAMPGSCLFELAPDPLSPQVAGQAGF